MTISLVFQSIHILSLMIPYAWILGMILQIVFCFVFITNLSPISVLFVWQFYSVIYKALLFTLLDIGWPFVSECRCFIWSACLQWGAPWGLVLFGKVIGHFHTWLFGSLGSVIGNKCATMFFCFFYLLISMFKFDCTDPEYHVLYSALSASLCPFGIHVCNQTAPQFTSTKSRSRFFGADLSLLSLSAPEYHCAFIPHPMNSKWSRVSLKQTKQGWCECMLKLSIVHSSWWKVCYESSTLVCFLIFPLFLVC